MDQKKREEVAKKMGNNVAPENVVLLPPDKVSEGNIVKMDIYAARVGEFIMFLCEYDDGSYEVTETEV